MSWRIVDTGSASAQENMDWDRDRLETLHPDGDPLLRFYQWKNPCFTHGYFIDPWRHLSREKMAFAEWEVARRPTGGGITWHENDFPYSLFLPSGHPWCRHELIEVYRLIHENVCHVLEETFPEEEWSLLSSIGEPKKEEVRFFCMTEPVLYDLAWKGKKIGGAALRRTKKGWLFQGFIALQGYDTETIAQWISLGPSLMALLGKEMPLFRRKEMFASKERLFKENFAKHFSFL